MDKDLIKAQVAEKGYASLTHAQKDIYNTSTATQPITADSLAPTTPITIPPQPPVPPLNAMVAGATTGATYQPTNTQGVQDQEYRTGNVLMKFDTTKGWYQIGTYDAQGNLIKTGQGDTGTTGGTTGAGAGTETTGAGGISQSVWDKLKEWAGITSEDITQPPIDYVAEEKRLAEEQGQAQNIEDLNAANAELSAAQAEFDAMQMEQQYIPLRVQEEFTGRAGVGQQKLMSEAELRKNALAMLPVAQRVLVASAKVNAAQGRYDLAEKNINKILELEKQTRDDTYQWRKDMYNLALSEATTEQAEALREAQATEDAEQKKADELLDEKRDAKNEAIRQGDYATAAKIALATSKEEVAQLLSQIKPATGKATTTTPISVGDEPLSINQIEQFRRSYGWTPPFGFTESQLLQFMADNPNATPEELEAAAKQAMAGETGTIEPTTPTNTPDEVITKILDTMSDAQLKALKKKADEAGISSMWKGKRTDVKNYLNSIKDKIQTALNEGFSVEEIIDYLTQ